MKVKLPECTKIKFIEIKFKSGKIVDETLKITPIEDRPYFRRVRFKVRINFVVKVKNIETGATITIPGELPLIQKDIVMFMPDARNEFKFEIVIETASQLLTTPIEEGGFLNFAVGVFVIIKVVGKVQLLIPEFGFCPVPDDCEDFRPDDVCPDFDEAPFPEFFPKQFNNIFNND